MLLSQIDVSLFPFLSLYCRGKKKSSGEGKKGKAEFCKAGKPVHITVQPGASPSLPRPLGAVGVRQRDSRAPPQSDHGARAGSWMPPSSKKHPHPISVRHFEVKALGCTCKLALPSVHHTGQAGAVSSGVPCREGRDGQDRQLLSAGPWRCLELI